MGTRLSHLQGPLERLQAVARERPIPLETFDVALDSYHAALARAGSPLGRFAGVRALCGAMRMRFMEQEPSDVPYQLRTQVAAKACLAYLEGQDLFPNPEEGPLDFMERYTRMTASAPPGDLAALRRGITADRLATFQSDRRGQLGYRFHDGPEGVIRNANYSVILRGNDLICGVEVVIKANRLSPLMPDVSMMLAGGMEFASIGTFSPHGVYGLVNQLRAHGRYIVPVYDGGMVGESSLQGFLAMKRMDRGSLADNLAELITQPVATRVELLQKLTRAVAEQHDHGLRRLDLKPDNILLHGGGKDWDAVEVGLIDLTAAVHGDEPDPFPQAVFGVKSYLPVLRFADRYVPFPGDSLGHKKTWDTFSLGVIAYELLAGETVTEGEAVARRVTDDAWFRRQYGLESLPPPPPPRHFKAERIPTALRPVVLRAVSDNPHDWYPDGGSFRRALESAG